MLDHDDGDALLVQPEEDGQDVVHLGAGQPGHGLVGDEQLRPRRHGARQLELAHLDLGEPGGPQVRLGVEPDRPQDLRGVAPPSPRARATAPRTPARCSRFSRTVMLVNGLGIWKLRAMPSRVRW